MTHARTCEVCGHFPVHAAQGYHAPQARCLWWWLGYDCRLCVNPGRRSR